MKCPHCNKDITKFFELEERKIALKELKEKNAQKQRDRAYQAYRADQVTWLDCEH